MGDMDGEPIYCPMCGTFPSVLDDERRICPSCGQSMKDLIWLQRASLDQSRAVSPAQSGELIPVPHRIHGLAWSKVRSRMDVFEDGTSGSMARMDALAVAIVDDVLALLNGEGER